MFSKYKFACDLLLWIAATPLAFWLRLDSQFPNYLHQVLILTAVGIPLKAFLVFRFGLYRQSWPKIGVRDLVMLIRAIGIATVVLLVAAVVMQRLGVAMPRSVPLIEAMFTLIALSGTRLVARIRHEYRTRDSFGGTAKRVLIVGAGEAGTMMAREMVRHPGAGLKPIGFVDDENRKKKQTFLGLPVLGTIEELEEVCSDYAVDEILIAIPSAPGSVVRRILDLADKAGIQRRIIPGIYDLLSGKISISAIREVDVEDLLRREPISLDIEEIASYLKRRVVLITGAGGSIGSELVRQVSRFSPDKVVLVGRGENSLYTIEQEVRRDLPHLAYELYVADVRDRDRLAHIFAESRPDVVFHAAAHKHVPLMESNPDQAIFNNVAGTRNLVELSLEHGVARFVNISTDKAVNPTSVMGASKRVAEQVVSWGAHRASPGQSFVSVRFGNVLGSRGSVIPMFKEQIRRHAPLTVTHPDMTRYFMTIPEASELVLQAGGLGENGSVYVLDMGEPVRIMDLARDLIRLSGLTPGQDIDIIVSGMRPGEKLYEELLTAEEGTIASRHKKIFVARKTDVAEDVFVEYLELLLEAAASHDPQRIREALGCMIPFYAGAEQVPAPQAIR